MSRRKPKGLDAVKEAKRQARRQVGSPPPVQRHGDRQRKPPKHKKRTWDEAVEQS